MIWTADQVIKLVGEIGGIVGTISVMMQALHNNKAIAINSSNNAHQTIIAATQAKSETALAPGAYEKLTIETKDKPNELS